MHSFSRSLGTVVRLFPRTFPTSTSRWATDAALLCSLMDRSFPPSCHQEFISFCSLLERRRFFASVLREKASVLFYLPLSVQLSLLAADELVSKFIFSGAARIETADRSGGTIGAVGRRAALFRAARCARLWGTRTDEGKSGVKAALGMKTLWTVGIIACNGIAIAPASSTRCPLEESGGRGNARLFVALRTSF